MLKKMTPFQQRLVMSLIGIFIALTAIFLSPLPAFKPIFTAIVAAIIAISLWEFYQIARAKGIQPNDAIGIVIGVVYVVAVALSTQYHAAHFLPQITLLGASIACFFHYFIKEDSPFLNLSVIALSIVYLVIPLSFMISVVYFTNPEGTQDGRWWLLYLLIVTKVTDAAGFFIGKKFGHKLLAPYISPKKTWEGAIGGLFSAIIVSVLFGIVANLTGSAIFEITLWQSVWLGLAIGVLAQFGDLSESLLKRDAGIKDSNHLPGLGGILDIVDSLVFTTPLIYLFLRV